MQKNAAFLIGISNHPDHPLAGVPNDLTLLTQALQHRNYSNSTIHCYGDTHTKLAELHALFVQIQNEYREVETGSCYVHIGASGALSLAPLAGGIVPSDGDDMDFRTVFPFAALNEYLPVRDNIRVIVTLDA